uniref:aurora kinase A- and ninein-interacting protein n=1 Tax=Semicossyphus pulcher TaxID=241346 RepID=UPI0037E7FC9E
MKTSKPALKTSVQEECGVWLDTVQLKGKAKQKRLNRPISKLLNPFTGGRGYNLAVALNFTQTKLEMPKTKQSSISTFFSAQRRVLNKMSSEEPNMDPVLPPSPSNLLPCASTSPTPVTSGRKRRREIDHDSEPGLDHEQKCDNVAEPVAEVCWDQAESHAPSKNMNCELEKEQFEEINPPQSKRRLILTNSLPLDSQPVPQAWSQDPLLTCSQFSEEELDLNNQKTPTEKNFSDSEPSFHNSLQSEEAFGVRMDFEARTSTQKAFTHFKSSQMDDEKENSRFFSSLSPSKRRTLCYIEPLSNHKRTEPKTASPRKNIPLHPWKKADKEQRPDSQFKWTEPSVSPLKKRAPLQSGRAVDEDSLAMMFTQDSEGFRVIAHRGLQARSPLKDQSNINAGIVRSSAYQCLVEEDEEDDMLFTQDSQGNVVIKH